MCRRTAVFAAALLSCVLSTTARADTMDMPSGQHEKGGIGFHNSSAPLGVRWWLGGERYALDLGLGFHSEKALPDYPDEKVTGWALDLGVPIVLKSWDQVHVLFRPGVYFASQGVVVTDPPDPFDTENEKTFAMSGEIEVEAFLLKNFSVSASTGLAYESIEPAGGGEKFTAFSTIGNDFTNVGFHVYLF
jgi:hypothetical protein